MEVTKMLINETDGSESEVEVVTSFYNNDETKQYVMYTKGEKQGDNTIVYISIVKKKEDKVYLEEIEDDEEWTNVKSRIRDLLA